jgi:RadC-like JAB domain
MLSPTPRSPSSSTPAWRAAQGGRDDQRPRHHQALQFPGRPRGGARVPGRHHAGAAAQRRCVLLLLDSRHRVTGFVEVARGTVNASRVNLATCWSRRSWPTAPPWSSSRPPEWRPSPSPADRRVTTVLGEACDLVGISLPDHLVVTDTAHHPSERRRAGRADGAPRSWPCLSCGHDRGPPGSSPDTAVTDMAAWSVEAMANGRLRLTVAGRGQVPAARPLLADLVRVVQLASVRYCGPDVAPTISRGDLTMVLDSGARRSTV